MKKAKIFISLLCAMALVLGSFPAMGFADERDITVIVDGVTLDPAAGKAQIVGSGTTMVPFRSIFEALGFEVDYSESGGAVTFVMGFNAGKDILIGMAVGGNVIYKCSYSDYLSNSSALVNSPYSTVSEKVFIDETGRTLVPARAISETLGAEVLWVAGSKTVIITYETKDYYSATDIPRYEYITGEECISVDYDAYGNPVYVYSYPDPVGTFNYDYVGALNDAGFTIVDSNLDDINKQTLLFESPTNNYLLARASADEYVLNIIPYSNKIYPYYIMKLSGTGIGVTQLPNYTYFTGKECSSWKVSDVDHIYTYKYDYDEVSYYFEILNNMGYECIMTDENGWFFQYGNFYIGITINPTLGYISLTTFVGDSAHTAESAIDNGETYYDTDIPTFYAVTGIEPSDVEFNSNYSTYVFTYVCTDSEYRAYIRELESEGFVDVTGDYSIMESPTNKYVQVTRSGQSVLVVALHNSSYYVHIGIPNYTAATKADCLSWTVSDYGSHIYFYEYSEFDFNTYRDYLIEKGYEIISQDQLDTDLYGKMISTDMSDGYHVVEIVCVPDEELLWVELWIETSIDE